ncbi:hypothetical protein NL676_000528 [Syzygium grande]|nr:hypothetical protein NL676_000528 [Syzygium grande]
MTSCEIQREADLVMTKEIRDVAPAHYVLKIESFSLFAKNNKEKYESNEFEAGCYKWKLILYPNGDKSRNGEDHISVYLAVSGTSPFQLGGVTHVAVRFSLYDQIYDRYLIKQGRVTRFHALRTDWGVPRYMPLKIFADPSNGYLVDDTCVFGVETGRNIISLMYSLLESINGRCGYARVAKRTLYTISPKLILNGSVAPSRTGVGRLSCH